MRPAFTGFFRSRDAVEKILIPMRILLKNLWVGPLTAGTACRADHPGLADERDDQSQSRGELAKATSRETRVFGTASNLYSPK